SRHPSAPDRAGAAGGFVRSGGRGASGCVSRAGEPRERCRMNAELLRNAWLELTPSRLLLAPIVLGAIFLVVWYASERDVGAVASAAGSIYFVIALVWGSRRAANALADEVTGSTWDSQRMTALGPWSMAWGKFVGGTAYVWYAALIALAVSVALDPFSHDATERFFLAVGSICIGL